MKPPSESFPVGPCRKEAAYPRTVSVRPGTFAQALAPSLAADDDPMPHGLRCPTATS